MSKTFALIIFICLFVFMQSVLYAQAGNVVLPIIFYSEETGLGLGATDIVFFKNTEDKYHSNVNSIVFGTTKKQFLFAARPEIYLDENYIIDGFILYSDFTKKFYGVGNKTVFNDEEDYINNAYGFGVGFNRKFLENVKFGIQYNLQDLHIRDEKNGGLLENYDTDGLVSGFGFKASLDTRDNNIYPQKGCKLDVSWVLFNNQFSSNFNYSETVIDFRNYIEIKKDVLFAYQIYSRLLNGEPPVQMLSTFGGANHMRGFYSGRYVDKIVMILQPEIKIKATDIFQIALFSGIGNVYNDFESVNLKQIKISSGVGLRIQLNKNPKINLRTDFAASSESTGFYLTILEAF
ncbi:MAG: BamA/TamA family outer membrane protein [Endomicrobiaceae bacterium]|nr:BamA/TamA family outer membrane protein [Endomicrobiaceae bacterium]